MACELPGWLAVLGLGLVAACGDDIPVGAGGNGESGGAALDGGGSANDGAGPAAGGGGGDAPADCVPDEVLAALDAFLVSFDAAAEMIAGHPGTNEAAGFFLAPGLPEPPGVVATFAGLFMAPCSEPSEFVPYCELGRCSQLECTGEGSSWGFHFYLDRPSSSRGFEIAELAIDHHWADGDSGDDLRLRNGVDGPRGSDLGHQWCGRARCRLCDARAHLPDLARKRRRAELHECGWRC